MFAILITAIVAAPQASVLMGLSPWLTTGLERFLALILFFFSAGLLIRHIRKRPERLDSSPQIESDKEYLLFFLPAIPWILFTLVSTFLLRGSLYPGDFDYTLVSDGINRTAKGEGILPTPYVATGTGTSFLGHHFSPFLILLAPLYKIALIVPGTDHTLYAFILWAALATGLLLWIHASGLFLKRFQTRLIVAGILSSAVPLWRAFYSLHFESLAFPLSALWLLTGVRKQRIRFALVSLLLASIKEDMAIYMILALAAEALHQLVQKNKKDLFRFTIPTISGLALYFVFARWMMLHLSGGEGPDWSSYFREGNIAPWKTLEGLHEFLLSFAYLPLVALLRTGTGWIPIVMIHGWSGHPWHQSFYGHYGYTILPFLFYGTIRGALLLDRFLKRNSIPPAILVVGLGLSLYGASRDRQIPGPLPLYDSRIQDLQELVERIPSHSCVQTQFHFSPLVPLVSSPYPLHIPMKNPIWTQFEGNIPGEGFIRSCPHYCLLLDPTESMEPYYSRSDIEHFSNFAQTRLDLLKNLKTMNLYCTPEPQQK